MFDENIFPFSRMHTNAGARLRSEINLLRPVLLPLTISSHGGEHVVADPHANVQPDKY